MDCSPTLVKILFGTDTASGFRPDTDCAARDRFYPGWWTYGPGGLADEANKPFYRVICRTDEDCLLAARVKPPYVRAEIVRWSELHKPNGERSTQDSRVQDL